MAGGGPAGASLVDRTLDVLESFDDAHRRLSLTQIARRSGLAPPTALRIVRQLVARGALSRNDGGDYVIGRTVWDLGLLAPVQTDVRELASPFLHDLHAATRATVHLAVRDGDEVLYLDRLAGHASVPVVSRVGSRLPLHATGVGKVLLAHAPQTVQEAVLADLRRITPYTITQPDRLSQQLHKVRRDGYAVTIEEMTLGACSIAVPVSASVGTSTDDPPTAGDVRAALGVVVPSLQRDKQRLVTALTVAARGISRNLS